MPSSFLSFTLYNAFFFDNKIQQEKQENQQKQQSSNSVTEMLVEMKTEIMDTIALQQVQLNRMEKQLKRLVAEHIPEEENMALYTADQTIPRPTKTVKATKRGIKYNKTLAIPITKQLVIQTTNDFCSLT
jgi:hypothetical protein